MALVYTSLSGAESDQFDHPTVNAQRSVVLQEIVPGTALAPGEYDGEPLIWNGIEWGPQNIVRVNAVQADPSDNLQISAGTLGINSPGEISMQGGPDSFLAMTAPGMALLAPVLLLQVSDGSVRVQCDAAGVGFFGVSPVPRQSITGTTEQEQIDSIVAALVALGLATDDR